MKRIQQGLLGLVGAVALVAVPATAEAAGTATAAASGPINYSCGPNVTPGGFIASPVTNRTARIGSAVVQLRGGVTPANVWGWARIYGAKVGEKVWLDWSDNGGSRWHICGPVKIRTGHDTHTNMVNYVPGRKMRACGRHAGVTKCTAWQS